LFFIIVCYNILLLNMAAATIEDRQFLRVINDGTSRVLTSRSFVVIGVSIVSHLAKESKTIYEELALGMCSENGQELEINMPLPSNRMGVINKWSGGHTELKVTHGIDRSKVSQSIADYLTRVRAGPDDVNKGILFVASDGTNGVFPILHEYLQKTTDWLQHKLYACDMASLYGFYHETVAKSPDILGTGVYSFDQVYKAVLPNEYEKKFYGMLLPPVKRAAAYLQTALAIGTQVCLNLYDPVSGGEVLLAMCEEAKDYDIQARQFLASCCETFHELGLCNDLIPNGVSKHFSDTVNCHSSEGKVGIVLASAESTTSWIYTHRCVPTLLSMIHNTKNITHVGIAWRQEDASLTGFTAKDMNEELQVIVREYSKRYA
jgi:hypothetical protein